MVHVVVGIGRGAGTVEYVMMGFDLSRKVVNRRCIKFSGERNQLLPTPPVTSLVIFKHLAPFFNQHHLSRLFSLGLHLITDISFVLFIILLKCV